MAAIAVVELNADINFVAATEAGDTIVSGVRNGNHVLDGVFLLVNNGSGDEIDVTVDGTVYAVPDGEIHALPANGGINPGRALTVTYEDHTTVTVAAFRT